MKVLRNNRQEHADEQLKRFVGFYIGDKTHVKIQLMAILSKKGKSLVMRDALTQWLDDQPDEKELAVSISDQLYHLWESDHKIIGSEQVTLQKFKKDVRGDFQSLGLPDKLIKEIIELFDSHVQKYK